MSSSKHPYLKREFWLKKQEEFTENPNFTEKGNKTAKELIDKFVNEIYAK